MGAINDWVGGALGGGHGDKKRVVRKGGKRREEKNKGGRTHKTWNERITTQQHTVDSLQKNGPKDLKGAN